jgi:hypothetical protein
MVVGVKYYTSLEMRKLERRLETVKDGLQQAKDRHKITETKQEETETEEAGQCYASRENGLLRSLNKV